MSARAAAATIERAVMVRRDGPRGRWILHTAVDFLRVDDGARIACDYFEVAPAPGQLCWIRVAAPHPDAGTWLARFDHSYNVVFDFVDLRPAEPAPGEN
ncbi:hypothetical protein [Lysobacter enzymogenes]|uniref:hypothetical protein n=1 Tax=Lysobacter enzymogenes TaxID=69 RepID=UPI001A95A27C|nr:hypothetical protein [Lysobacter enzymogenes]QQP94813.1 hypothetical protein JHW38_16370 [Lysobacter enzymogenes]